MRLSRKIGFAGLAGALALAVAGCGGTAAVSHAPKPTPKVSAKAPKPVSGLTLAEASSYSYHAVFPVVPCSSDGAYGQIWESSGLLGGQPISQCPPADFLSKYTPTQGITVKNMDAKISKTQANAIAVAIVNDQSWMEWAQAALAPGIETKLGVSTGGFDLYPTIIQGWRQVGWMNGNGVWPISITIILLTASGDQTMLDPGAPYAVVLQYQDAPCTLTVQKAGQKPYTYVTAAAKVSEPQIYTGHIASSPALGSYFAVASYIANCSSGVGVGLCAQAGAY